MSPIPLLGGSFWCICERCKTHFGVSLIPYANYIPRCPRCGKKINQESDIIDSLLSWAKDVIMSDVTINKGDLFISYNIPHFKIQCSLLHKIEGRIIDITTREFYLKNASDIETVQTIFQNDFDESHKVRIAELCRENDDIMVLY